MPLEMRNFWNHFAVCVSRRFGDLRQNYLIKATWEHFGSKRHSTPPCDSKILRMCLKIIDVGETPSMLSMILPKNIDDSPPPINHLIHPISMIPTRKRILILLCLVFVVVLFVRLLLYDRQEPVQYRREAGAPVLVTVFYEALCPDSKFFIMKQLLPAYKAGAPLMEIQLVPYGKAHTSTNEDGTFTFDCQHGEKECQANMYHSCAIEAIQDPVIRLEVIACMIRDNRLPKEAMQKCVKQHSVENADLIEKCYDSSHAAELLKLSGDATHALRPAVSFIPTITLDGSQGRQASILKSLLSEVCKIAGDTDQAAQICKDH